MLLEVASLGKAYSDGTRALPVLQGVSFALGPGELLAVVGPSGCGKTTLLQLIAGLDRPTSGEVRFRGARIDALGDREASAFRRRQLGFVFQSFHLLPALTVLENVTLPLLIDGCPPKIASAKARTLLDELGLAGRHRHLPSLLSGGERQRVGIARALVADPDLILADEPTGCLDAVTGREVLDALTGAAHRRRRAVLLVTHDEAAARLAARTIRLPRPAAMSAHSAVSARRISSLDASQPG